jgi:hypothetical protein
MNERNGFGLKIAAASRIVPQRAAIPAFRSEWDFLSLNIDQTIIPIAKKGAYISIETLAVAVPGAA